MSDVWTWYGWRCGHALRRDPAHRHALPDDEAALGRLLARVARRRGRWLVVDATDGRTFGQCVAVGHGLLGVELSDPVDKTIWPLHALPTPLFPAVVRLRRTSHRFAPVWFPPRALFPPVEASAVIAGHLDGCPLPLCFDSWAVDAR